MSETDQNPTGAESGDQDRAISPSTLPATATRSQSEELDSHGETVKPYLEAIDATGARTQKVCLLAIALLTVLFFGLLLPSLGALERVRDLRAEKNNLELQIGVHYRKMEARRAAIKRERAAQAFFASATGSEQKRGCTDYADELKSVKESVANVKKDLTSQIGDRNRKEDLTKFVRERGRDIDTAIRAIEKSKSDKDKAADKSKDQKNNPSPTPSSRASDDKDSCLRTSIREFRDELGLLKLTAQQADVADRLSAESMRTIPLGFLGVFGLKLDGLNEARVPLLYLPLFWSIILLALLLYASYARSSMLNIYARALCINNQSTFSRELGPLSRSSWWWLAPLPRLDGSKVSAQALKSALGWARFELVAILGVVLLQAGLLAMQAIVVWISWRAASLLTSGSELLVISIAIGLLALWSSANIFQWLWTRRLVPDFGTNEEAPGHYRRTFVSMLVIGVAGGLFLRILAPASASPHIHTSPRFRKKRPRRAIVVNDEPLSVGFYLNKCTAVIHYVSLRRFPQPTQPRERRKRRRIRRLRVEARRRHSNLNATSTKRARETTFERRAGKPEEGNQNDRMLREVWRMSRTPQNFVPIKIEGFFSKPPTEPGSTDGKSADGSKNLPAVMPATKRNHAAQSRLENMKPRPLVAVLWDTSAYKCSTHKPRLHGSQAAFSIEQEVLRKLASNKQTPNISSEKAASDRNEVCDLLEAAISNDGGPSYLRLYDLLAVIALQNNREDILKWLIDLAGNSSANELKARARRWAGEGKWRSRWSLTQEMSYRYKRKEWSGLPM